MRVVRGVRRGEVLILPPGCGARWFLGAVHAEGLAHLLTHHGAHLVTKHVSERVFKDHGITP